MKGNIYYNARMAAGLTQERWAELLGLTADTIRRYENGERLPDDYTVKTMAEISQVAALGYWHICRKCELLAGELPKVERLPLSQAVIRLLLAVKEIEPDIDTLLEIARDGKVSHEEDADFEAALETLDGLVGAALGVKYAEGTD